LGLYGDGTTSDAANFEKVVSFANSFGVTSGITLHFDGGYFNLKAGITGEFTASNVKIFGEGATIQCDLGTIFNAADSSTQINGFFARGFTFEYPSVITDTNAAPFYFQRVVWGGIDEIILDNAPRLARLEGASSAARCNGIRITNIKGVTADVGVPVINLSNVAVIFVDHIQLLPDSPLVGDDDVSTSSISANNSFLYMSGAVDTLEIGDDVLINRYRVGIHSVTTSGQVHSNVTISRFWGDYTADNAILLDVGGTVNHWTIDRPYCRATDGDGIAVNVSATGFCFNMDIVKPTILLCGRHGLNINTTSASRTEGIRIIEPRCEANNRLSLSGNDIEIDTARFELIGGKVGRKSDGLYLSGYSVQCVYGVNVASSDFYKIKGVSSGGATGSYNLPSHASGSRQREVWDNTILLNQSAVSKPEYQTVVSSSIPATTVPYVNTTPHKLQVNTRSTTGTVDAATITIDGVTVHNKTDWQGELLPGETITITRAGAMAWVVRALS